MGDKRSVRDRSQLIPYAFVFPSINKRGKGITEQNASTLKLKTKSQKDKKTYA
jgi:hypothetical protein